MMADMISMTTAQARLGVSKNHLRRLVQRHGITLYENPIDAREKLLDFDELKRALEQRRPIVVGDAQTQMGKVGGRVSDRPYATPYPAGVNDRTGAARV